MNNRNKVREAVREQIFIKRNNLFEKLEQQVIYNGPINKHHTKSGKKIVELFRNKIGYSKSTTDCDILNSAFLNWKRYKNSGRAMYNNYRYDD